MSKTPGGMEESCKSEHDENHYSVILGFWDHEKTPNLIKELEESVNSVEQKCKKLLEELIYYKKYLDECDSRHAFRLNEKGKKSSQNSRLLCGSDPDISFRKKLMSNQQLAHAFEQKFQEKLHNIHRELSKTADKIGLKNNIVLFPTEDYLKTIESETQQQIAKTWSDVCQEFLKMNYFISKTKSETMVGNLSSEEYAQITKNELEVYQKLSRLSMKKRKRREGKEGRRVKFSCVKRPTTRLEETLRKLAKERRKRRRRRIYVSRERSKTSSQASDNQLKSRSLMEVLKTKDAEKPKEQEEEQGTKVSLGSVIRKLVPFTTCASTSRSYNIGVNVQQFLSQTKYEKTKDLEKRKLGRSLGERGQTGWKAPSTFQSQDNVWISEQNTSSNIRKVRSKYTGSAPEGYVEYHKSTMSQYTNGQKSMIKSESKTAYAFGSKIMLSNCRRTDYYQIDKDGMYYASGDGECNECCCKVNLDWAKVYGAFLDIYKKYSGLKKRIVEIDCGLSDRDIELLEKEIESAMNKYKEFLQFYSKYLQLKNRLKSLKMPFGTKMFESMSSFPSDSAPKTTNSMAMKKALREIQDLQEKIRLIRDY